jgi:RNA polymerase sigma-70 factor (ECF subfamily)
VLRSNLIPDADFVARLYEKAGAHRWALPQDDFADALRTSAERAFAGAPRAKRDVERYLSSLHLADLALACACARGHEEAWDHFVRELRPVLYRAADALDPQGGARELADSLYADLFGLKEDGEGERKSLFRYFHGRSSLATWLRAVLSQRQIDRVRSRRRLEPLPDEDVVVAPATTPDPDDSRLRAAVVRGMTVVVARLAPKDLLRLRSYYVMQLTLAQIGRITREHEATVSRQLARTRRQLHDELARELREAGGLRPAEVARAFEIVLADPAGLDLRTLLGAAADRKVGVPDRSRYEGHE